ncbi:MAG: ABC transporter substrate-binding protein [Deltaproteobacteria bacterium]|nr:ABC transporter substrate-binding protein [Deltaproteobacteria bacterium]
MRASDSTSRLATTLLGAAWLLTSCTLGTLDHRACTGSADCRVFGVGSVCQADGFCGAATPEPRCDTTYPEDLFTRPEAYPNVFLLGTLYDASLETHVARAQAVQLAVMQANEDDGVGGRPVGLVLCTIAADLSFDRLDRQQAAVSTARYLADALGIQAIVGPPSSGETQAVFEALDADAPRVLIVSPSATSPLLTGLEPPPSDSSPGLLWRTAAPDSLQGRVIAQDMIGRGVTRVALVSEGGAYGEGLSTVFRAAFETLGGTVTAMPYANGAGLNTSVRGAAAADVDSMLFVSSQTSDVVDAMVTADVVGWPAGKGIFVTDSAANGDFLLGSASAAALYPMLRGTRPAPASGPVFDAFTTRYAATFAGEDARDSSFTAQSWDATWLILAGGTWAQSQGLDLEAVPIARGLRQLSAGVSVDFGSGALAALRAAFASDSSADVRGASGELEYDPLTEETVAPIQLWTIAGDATAGFRIEPGEVIAP